MTPADAARAGRNLGIKIDNARVDIALGSLTFLIATAYRTEAGRVTGPDWMAAQRFDIQANLPEGATSEQVPEMLQALLAERFKLAVHHEQKEQQVYALTVDKSGLKIQESAPGAGMSDKPFPNGADGRMLITVIHGSDGLATISMWKGAQVFEAEKISMTDLGRDLQRYIELPIVDRTGLKGTYQVALNVPPPLRRRPQGSDDQASDPGGVSIFNSVQKLGLRLEKRKVPLDYVIVDHVERSPGEN